MVGDTKQRAININIELNSHLCNLPTLVVTAQNCNTIPVANFESNQQRDGFQRIISSIYIITHEEIV